jgi:hypothetical protein
MHHGVDIGYGFKSRCKICSFTRLQVRAAVESVSDRQIHLHLGNGLHLEMQTLPPVEWLAALARLDGVR